MQTTARFIILLLLGLSILSPAAASQDGSGSEAMFITLPAELIKRSLQAILPLDLDESNQHLDGRLLLHSIDELIMGENSAVIQVLVIGKDLSLATRVGNQDLRIKVGDLRMPLTCDLLFRYDARGQVLYVTPRLRGPVADSPTDMSGSVASLLTLFNNREYPVSLTSLRTFNVRIGGRDVAVDMEPVDIRVVEGMLHIKMVPRVSKTD